MYACAAFTYNFLADLLNSDKTLVHVQAFVVYIALLPIIAGIAWLTDVACRSEGERIKRD